jgi:glutamate 5-kinase
VESGHQVLVVSSGAVAAVSAPWGLRSVRKTCRRGRLARRWGQGRLMSTYTDISRSIAHRAQLLLTHSDLDSRIAIPISALRWSAAREPCVPIINENDTVAVEELRFGDNDKLSAEVAILAEAQLLVLLTSVDGLLDAKGRTIPRVDDIEKVSKFVREDKGRLSVGGMSSKLQA